MIRGRRIGQGEMWEEGFGGHCRRSDRILRVTGEGSGLFGVYNGERSIVTGM